MATYDAILEGKTGLMSALVEGRYDVPIPDVNLGPRKLDSQHYNTERYRPNLREQAGAADLSQPRVIGWQVVTQSSAWLAAATFPLRSETRDEYCAFRYNQARAVDCGFRTSAGL